MPPEIAGHTSEHSLHALDSVSIPISKHLLKNMLKCRIVCFLDNMGRPGMQLGLRTKEQIQLFPQYG